MHGMTLPHSATAELHPNHIGICKVNQHTTRVPPGHIMLPCRCILHQAGLQQQPTFLRSFLSSLDMWCLPCADPSSLANVTKLFLLPWGFRKAHICERGWHTSGQRAA